MDARGNLPWRNLRPSGPVGTFGLRVGAMIASGALVLSGCAAHRSAPMTYTGVLRAADVALVRFTSCADALRSLRSAAGHAAAGNTVGSGGFAVSSPAVADAGSGAAGAGSHSAVSAVPGAAPAGAPAAASRAGAGQPGAGQASAQAAPGSYSGTTTAEAGVDEPDLVKTDGRRLVTIIDA